MGLKAQKKEILMVHALKGVARNKCNTQETAATRKKTTATWM
jgi:hypothetical protein